MRRAFRITSTSVLTLAVAAGCSLVNSLDEVEPADDGKLTGDPRPAPTTSLEDAGLGPTGPAGDAEAGGSSGEDFSPLVVGGTASVEGSEAVTPVLAVLDSKTGRERGKRESMWVAGIAHDDARDVWYIFEAKSFLTTLPTETVKVHTRRLDLKTGLWTELSVYEGPPLVFADAIAVTTQRISYVAYPGSDASTKNRLVTVDTSNLAAPVFNSSVDLDELPRAMSGVPSLTGPGGNLSLVNTGRPPTDCVAVDGGTRCKVRIRRFLLPNGGTPTPGVTTTHGGMNLVGSPGFGSVTCKGGPDDILVLPGVGPDADDAGSLNGVQSLVTVDYAIGTETGTAKTFNMSTTIGPPALLRRVAVDNPRRIVFVVEANNDTALYAVPLDATDPTKTQKANLRHSGQSVYYDPASETAFAPFNQGEGKTFSPIRVSGGKDGAPIQLKERTSSEFPGGDWDPPEDLRPNYLGIRLTGQSCP